MKFEVSFFFFCLYNVKGAAHGAEGSKKKIELSLE